MRKTLSLLFVITLFTVYFFWRSERMNKKAEEKFQRETEKKGLIKSETPPFPISSPSVKKEQPAYSEKKENPFKMPTPQAQTRIIKEEHIALQDSQGNTYIQSAIIYGKHVIAHGDLIIGNIDEINRLKREGKPIIIAPPKLWTDNEVPYVIDDIPNKVQVEQALEEIQARSNIQFIPRATEHSNFVRFSKGEQHCFSSVGMQGGEQIIALSERCQKKEISHEVLHTLGFFHEQNRPDRDDFLTILWENIKEDYWPQFEIIKIWGAEERQSPTPFSNETIMLYPSTSFSIDPADYSMVTTDGDAYSTPSGLTNLDVERINLLYPN
jgi:hypothetical protein